MNLIDTKELQRTTGCLHCYFRYTNPSNKLDCANGFNVNKNNAECAHYQVSQATIFLLSTQTEKEKTKEWHVYTGEEFNEISPQIERDFLNYLQDNISKMMSQKIALNEDFCKEIYHVLEKFKSSFWTMAQKENNINQSEIEEVIAELKSTKESPSEFENGAALHFARGFNEALDLAIELLENKLN